MTDWGPPKLNRAFSDILRYDPLLDRWDRAAVLARPRIYCATVALGGRIWVIGGDEMLPDGRRQPTDSVDILDPETGILASGPTLPFAQTAPLGVVAGERIYVVGHPNRNSRGRMDSIGLGEGSWRREPDGPEGMWALAGAEAGGLIYVSVPAIGLVSFDPARRTWRRIGGPSAPRSPQVVSWRSDIWIMGGRDVEDGRQSLIYRPADGSWHQGPSLPRPLSWGAAAAAENRIYLMGGASGTAQSERPYVYSDQVFAWPDHVCIKSPTP